MDPSSTMNLLPENFPSLSTFTDLDWEAVAKEYQPYSHQITFPEYLQIKAENGDCPAYLFELAFYDFAMAQVEASEVLPPETEGIHLNSTAAFLNLNFDLGEMLAGAEEGNFDVIERENVLCLFQFQDEIIQLEMDEDLLAFLESFEKGPVTNVPEEFSPYVKELLDTGLLITK